MKTVPLGPATASLRPGQISALSVRLPAAAVAALRAGRHESVSLTLSMGTSTLATVRVARLAGSFPTPVQDPASLSSDEVNPIPALGIIESVSSVIDVCPLSELPPGQTRVVVWDDMEIGVFNCAGELYAIEDRCSHDDGPLAEGLIDQAACTVECPRHGALFDLRTGKPKTLPAYVPVDTFPVIVDQDMIKLEVE